VPRIPRTIRLLVPVIGLALLASACGGGEPGSVAGDKQLKVAAIFSGATTDADYNALGLLALQGAEKSKGAQVAYSESVAVPDIERVMREYLADGFTVIWTHGSQFYEATAKLAKQNPNVSFIGEFDAKPETAAPNVWVIDRNFHLGFYPIGVLAAATTKSGKIAYVGGLSLPFSYSEVHALKQALKDSGSTATVTSVWTGDFNDPAKAQQITSQLLNQGVDVVVGSLNLGMVGVFQAVKDKPAGAWITAKYTDKSQFDPQHYATSVLYDFERPLDAILGKIEADERSGYYPLGFDTGVQIQQPRNVTADATAKLDKAIADVTSGEITVDKNVTPIK
jgi:basic membrane protein A